MLTLAKIILFGAVVSMYAYMIVDMVRTFKNKQTNSK